MSSFETAAVWSIACGAIAGTLFRPKGWREAVWPCLGASLLVLFRLLPAEAALGAVAKGADVYLFLTGMMLLAELARREGVFDWMAAWATCVANGSPVRLFALIYAVGILVTAFLSNDATAVVLTPAVYAAVRKARAEPLPYLFACAFIANAASFVLPVSNPANLVVFGKHLPALVPWLRVFLVPSLVSIAATYAALWWSSRHALRGDTAHTETVALTPAGKHAALGIVAAGAVLITASGLGFDLGRPTAATAAMVVLVATRLRPKAIAEVTAGVSWSVLPLVAGLFVIVEGLDRAGALNLLTDFLHASGKTPRFLGGLIASFGLAALSNVMNNLPSALLAGSAVNATGINPQLGDAVLIGVDLGPNLSVTGSLATILWLIALRREGVQMTAWRFLKLGIVVMIPALFLATLAVMLSDHP